MELDPVDRITADAVGEPGGRTFYLQAGKGTSSVTVVVEKEQVRLLAVSILEILKQVGRDTDEGTVPEEALALDEPVDAGWRAGRLSIGYSETRDLLVLDLEELVPEGEERPPEELRVWATREQMLSLARHATEVVASGRPTCPVCAHPMEPDGHWCPGTNGHREIGTV